MPKTHETTFPNLPLSTEIAARKIAAAWIEGALDAGIPRDAVPREVDADWIQGVGNAYWDRVAWSWRKHAGPGRDGYDVLARAATRVVEAESNSPRSQR